MGLFTDFVVKDSKKRFWITLFLDVLIIMSLVYFASTVKGEWQRGFDNCYSQSCELCFYLTHNSSVVDVNISVDIIGGIT